MAPRSNQHSVAPGEESLRAPSFDTAIIGQQLKALCELTLAETLQLCLREVVLVSSLGFQFAASPDRLKHVSR